eukprot:TRINITY_DN2024_c0_g2_i1.p1 TRINITY_DN2024_c0_g2~~TRINITY_DN2024_c0_g2_i1.p1  ORF type:complete len:274 (+),score=33.48 TRINITY_DN2024_c0_g2_i1:49-822(+)
MLLKSLSILLYTLLVNWIAYIPSVLLHTEHYYDLTGAIVNITAALLSYWLSSGSDLRKLLVTWFAVMWAGRLGYFLFARVSAVGHDARFEKVKYEPRRFFVYWTVQGVWTFATELNVYLVNFSEGRAFGTVLDFVGVGLFGLGWLTEIIADYQKNSFKSKPGNGDKFISTGLWAYSRHPNYFGEIVLWWGVWILCISGLDSTLLALIGILSPCFVTYLITRVSGIPILERNADKKYGADPKYQSYKKATPVLIPFLK